MTMRRILALVLALGVTGFSDPLSTNLIAQDLTGTLAGHSRYRDRDQRYEVRVQDTATGQIVKSAILDQSGDFSLAQMSLPGRFLIIVWDTERDRVVCTEGPYSLTADSPSTAAKLDIDVSCGKAPAALWLLALGGTTATVAALTGVQSETR